MFSAGTEFSRSAAPAPEVLSLRRGVNLSTPTNALMTSLTDGRAGEMSLLSAQDHQHKALSRTFTERG